MGPTPATWSPPTGRIEDLKVPRDRAGAFHTQVFERCGRYEPEVAEALMDMFVSGTSTQFGCEFFRFLVVYPHVRTGNTFISENASFITCRSRRNKHRSLRKCMPAHQWHGSQEGNELDRFAVPRSEHLGNRRERLWRASRPFPARFGAALQTWRTRTRLTQTQFAQQVGLQANT